MAIFKFNSILTIFALTTYLDLNPLPQGVNAIGSDPDPDSKGEEDGSVKMSEIGDRLGNASTESPAAKLAHTFRYTSNFTLEFLNFNYHDYRYVYCTGDVTIVGEKSSKVGSFYIFLYCLFLVLYIPSLIVIARPPLIKHAAYKLMLAVGIMDNVVGFFFTFLAGVYTIMGRTYNIFARLFNVVFQVQTTATTPTSSLSTAISLTASTSSIAPWWSCWHSTDTSS